MIQKPPHADADGFGWHGFPLSQQEPPSGMLREGQGEGFRREFDIILEGRKLGYLLCLAQRNEYHGPAFGLFI